MVASLFKAASHKSPRRGLRAELRRGLRAELRRGLRADKSRVARRGQLGFAPRDHRYAKLVSRADCGCSRAKTERARGPRASFL